VQSDEFYLSKLGVQQKARRLGYGRILLDQFLSMGTAEGLGAYETPIDKMLSLLPRRVTLEFVPDRGAEPRLDGL
jgi:ribosomal protein S18 acetylase RimI-like enzyme